MTSNQKPRDDMDVFLEALLSELTAMSDEEVLEGQDPAAIQAKGLAVLSHAKQEAARRRLETAKAGLKLARSDIRSLGNKTVSASEAKAFLKEAANSGSYTLAARQLESMSDEAALRLYETLVRLGAKPTKQSDDGS